MSDGKIRVSWDEMNAPEIDVKIKQQEMLGRAQEHQRQQGPPPLPSQSGRKQGTAVWYNSVFCMAIFGIIGGLSGWFVGEIFWIILSCPQDEYQEAMVELQELGMSVERGEMSETEGESGFARWYARYQDNPYVAVVMDDSMPQDEKDTRIEALAKHDRFKGFFKTFLWTSTVGMLLALSLSVAEPVVSRNWRSAIVNGSIGIIIGLSGGAVVGLFIDSLFRVILGDEDIALLRLMFARVIAWAILGLFLCIAPGIVLRNWKRFSIGLLGGLLGGLIGGVLFDPITMLIPSDVPARLVGVVTIGLVAGVGTGLIESVAKSGWLRVVGGLIAGKQFIIYKNPTYLGSSPQCEIYLFKDPQVGPRHAAIHTVPGGFELEDLQSATGTLVNGRPASRVRLRNNDQIQVGATLLLFQEKERTGV